VPYVEDVEPEYFLGAFCVRRRKSSLHVGYGVMPPPRRRRRNAQDRYQLGSAEEADVEGVLEVGWGLGVMTNLPLGDSTGPSSEQWPRRGEVPMRWEEQASRKYRAERQTRASLGHPEPVA